MNTGLPAVSRGQVYLVDLDPVKGREQSGYRPVLVVSCDAINAQPLVVTVVVGTGAENVTRSYPTNVRVSSSESGLPKDTVFLCFQLRSLDPGRFQDRKTGKLRLLGRLPPARLAEVELALRLTLGLG